MPGYADIITEALGCSPKDAAAVEDVMRHTIFHSTLDWQTREQLQAAAWDAVEVMRLMGDRVTTTKKVTQKFDVVIMTDHDTRVNPRDAESGKAAIEHVASIMFPRKPQPLFRAVAVGRRTHEVTVE